MTKSYYLIDLFSGIGGFVLGLLQAGFKFEEVYYSDIDKYANAIYRYNFPKHKELGNVKTIKTESLPEGKWIVTFGFPCQDLSIAGKRKGFEGKCSALFYEATRIIRNLQPEVFIFENVKGLFSANNGRDFISVLREIADIGLYDCEWQLVNTRWVLPQNRERIYFIGHLRGKSEPKVFPIREIIKRNTEKRTEQSANGIQISSTLNAGYPKMRGQGDLIKMGNIGSDSQGQRVYDSKGIGCQITAQGGGQGAKTGLYAIDLKTLHGSSKTRRGGIIKEKIPALDHNCSIGIANAVTPDAYLASGKRKRINGKAVLTSMHERRIRRLTPIECERLQGFPDDFTKYGIIDNKKVEISDTQRYKCLGNAVTIDIVEMIGRKLDE